MRKPMTAKERMLTALDRGVPDRLPASVHQWQPYHLNTYLGGISPIAAFRRFGLDAAVVAVDPEPEVDHSQWQVSSRSHRGPSGTTITEQTIVTPGGTLTQTIEESEQTQWVIGHIIKQREDMALLKQYMPVPRQHREPLQVLADEVGQDGILRGFVFGNQGGPWQDACYLYGTVEMIMATYDDHAWVHELLRALTDKKLQFVEQSLKGMPLDLIESGGGAASSTVISPDIFRDYCLPYDSEIHAALHDAGHRVVYHTCGGMMPILDLIVANGCDAAETLAPVGVGGDVDAGEVKRRIGDRVALIGGLDQFNVLSDGTPDEIRAEVHRLFEAAGAGGGYIISPSDHFFDTRPENLEAYAAAARECTS
ncbi:MAG: uroporphyrinogen decarboxylase family protein [Anaerolineae bacterium]